MKKFISLILVFILPLVSFAGGGRPPRPGAPGPPGLPINQYDILLLLLGVFLLFMFRKRFARK